MYKTMNKDQKPVEISSLLYQTYTQINMFCLIMI